jgi:hypothetical protein
VAKKFSLKDNPIFQRLEAPEPREAAPPAEEVSHSSNPQRSLHEGHNLTVSDRPSKIDRQILTSKEPSDRQAHVPALDAQVQSPKDHPSSRALKLKDHLDKSLFFSFFNEMVDDLLPTLDSNEQVLYIRLFRLSYGFNRNYCTVSQALLIERTGFSRNTVRTSVQSLAQKGWLRVVDAGNRVSTTYLVLLPRDKIILSQNSRSNSDPQKMTVIERPSENEGQNMSHKIRGSESNPQGGQNLDVQDLTLKNRPAVRGREPTPYARGSDLEGQELPRTYPTINLWIHM